MRVLRDALLAHDDWNAAAHDNAAEHDAYYARLHTLEGWLSDAFFDVGPPMHSARAASRAFAEPGRIPDLVAHGPDSPCDEAARRRLFAED